MEDARLALLEAVRRSSALHKLTLWLWFVLLLTIGGTVAREVFMLRGSLGANSL